MCKVLILGGSGMLGHKLYSVLSNYFTTFVSFRNYNESLNNTGIFNIDKVVDNINAFKFDSIISAIKIVQPDVIINCIGIIKQLDDAKNANKTIYVNSLFPHLLAEECEKNNAKLIHISTDCVFSGKRGNYTETDFADADDLYGRTKYLGEVNYGNNLTIRTSIIGHELFSDVSLIDWFLSQSGEEINGYSSVIYSGLPTITLSREIVNIIKNYCDLKGLYQLASHPISKYDLLGLVKNVYNTKIKINKSDEYKSDKSLCAYKYISTTNFLIPDWEDLVLEMHEDYKLINYKSIKNV